MFDWDSMAVGLLTGEIDMDWDRVNRDSQQMRMQQQRRRLSAEEELAQIRQFCIDQGVSVNEGESALEAVGNLATLGNARLIMFARRHGLPLEAVLED